MSTNKNLWVLHLPLEDFVDRFDSVVHFTGIEIGNEFLASEPRDMLRLIGKKIAEYTEEKRLGSNTHYWLVRSLNRTREDLSAIRRWLGENLPLEEGVHYTLKDILPMVDDLIADKTVNIPLFDSRFVPRELFGQCIQTLWKENENYEKRFASEILYPKDGTRPFILVRTVYHDTGVVPTDAYYLEIIEKRIENEGL
jgi:hypothetical protein